MFVNGEMKMSFATRHGFAREKPLQLTTIDDDLRYSLWNELDDFFKGIEELSKEYYSQQGTFKTVMEVC